jgi:hypothetical protein
MRATFPLRAFENLTMKLLIVDDFFPNTLSGFRVAEFNYYLNLFPEAEVHSRVTEFDTHFQLYRQNFPLFADRVRRFDESNLTLLGGRRPDIAYAVGLNTIYSFLPQIESLGIPFVFTLYPGFGFWLENEESDRKLKKVLRSPFFRRVITTQEVSKKYVINRNLCPAAQVDFHFGGPIPIQKDGAVPKSGEKFQVCFSAARYDSNGLDKGYDVFFLSALGLAHLPHIEFHVVGNWIPIPKGHPQYRENMTFHGFLHTRELHKLYESIDLIVSPNRMNHLAQGAFDGFPTACCAEASLYGVTMLCSDPLGLNIGYENGREIVVVEPSVKCVRDAILNLYNDPSRCREIGARGAKKSREILNLDAQMFPRIRALGVAAASTHRENEAILAMAIRSPEDVGPAVECLNRSWRPSDYAVIDLSAGRPIQAKYLAFWDSRYAHDSKLIAKQVALLESSCEFDISVVARGTDPEDGIAWLEGAAVPFLLPVIRADFKTAVERRGASLIDPSNLDFWARSFQLGARFVSLELAELDLKIDAEQVDASFATNQVLDISRVVPRALNAPDPIASAKILRQHCANRDQAVPLNLPDLISHPRAWTMIFALLREMEARDTTIVEKQQVLDKVSVRYILLIDAWLERRPFLKGGLRKFSRFIAWIMRGGKDLIR